MSAVQIACPAGGMLHGQVSVTQSAKALTANAPDKPLLRGVIVTNHHSSNYVFIGGDAVTSSTGHGIPPGQAIPYPIDDPTKLYVVSAAGGETVSWFAV